MMAFFHDNSSIPPEVQRNLKQAVKETAEAKRQLQLIESKLADARRTMHLPASDMTFTSTSAANDSHLPFSLQTNSFYSHLSQPKRRFVHEENRVASMDRWNRTRSQPRLYSDEVSLGIDRFDHVPPAPVVDWEENEEITAHRDVRRQQSRSPVAIQRNRPFVDNRQQQVQVSAVGSTDTPPISRIPISTGAVRRGPRVYSRPLVLLQTQTVTNTDLAVEKRLPQSARVEQIRQRFQESKKASTSPEGGSTSSSASRSQRSSSSKSSAQSSSQSSSLSQTSGAQSSSPSSSSSSATGRSASSHANQDKLTIVAIEENEVTRDPPAATANRRIVSPPTKRRKATVEAEQPAAAQQTNKKHHYSTDELQAFIDRQRRERKRHMQTEAPSDLPKHKERHYNEEKVRSYIEKKKKEQKTALSAVKRHTATLAAAKADRVERVIDEQKKRSTVSAATILLDGLLLNAASSPKPVDIEGIRERHARRMQNIGRTPEEMLSNWSKDHRARCESTQTEDTKRESTAQTELAQVQIEQSVERSFDKTVQTDRPPQPTTVDQALSARPDQAHSPIYEQPSQHSLLSSPRDASTPVDVVSGSFRLEADTEVETGDLTDANPFRSPPDPYNVVNTVVRKAQFVSSWQSDAAQPTTPVPHRQPTPTTDNAQNRLQEETFHTPASVSTVGKGRAQRFGQAILATSTPQMTPVKRLSLDSGDGEFFDAPDRSFDSPVRPTVVRPLQDDRVTEQQHRPTAQALGARLTAGLDYLDSVGHSLQEVQQVERLLQVTDARQQAISAAYLLKAQEAHEQEEQSMVDRERSRADELQRDVLRLIAEANERQARDAQQQQTNWSRVAADAAASATAAVLSALDSRQRSESSRRRKSGSESASETSARAKSPSVVQSSSTAPSANSSSNSVPHFPTTVPASNVANTTRASDHSVQSNSIATVLESSTEQVVTEPREPSDSVASPTIQSPKAESESSSSSSQSTSRTSWAEEKKEFGHSLVHRARHLGMSDQGSRRNLIHQRIEALKNYFSAQILVIHEQKRMLKSLPRGEDQISSLNAKQDRLSAEYQQLKRQARNSIDETLAERDFASMQLREIARLQSLTLHQQWQLDRLSGMVNDAADAVQQTAPSTSYQSLYSLIDNDQVRRSREQQLEKRRLAAERLLKLGRDLQIKEREIISLERRAHNSLFQSKAPKKADRRTKTDTESEKSIRSTAVSSSSSSVTSKSSKTSTPPTQSSQPTPMQINLGAVKSSESIQDEGSVVGPTEQISTSVSERLASTQKTSESDAISSVPTVGASSSSTNIETIKNANSDQSQSESSTSLSSSRNRRRKSQNKDPESTSTSFSGDTEVETRIQAFKASLAEKRELATKLKREHNRRTKEHLISTEQSLAKQIEAYDKFISHTQEALQDLEKSAASGSFSRPGTPRIRSPRDSLDGSRQGSPIKIVSPRRLPGSPTKLPPDWDAEENFSELHTVEEAIKTAEIADESLVEAVEVSESIPTAIPSATTHTSSSKTTAGSSSSTTSSSSSSKSVSSSTSEPKEKSVAVSEKEKSVVATVADEAERVLSPPFAPSVHEQEPVVEQSLKEPSLKHSGSLGDELDEDDRRTENDVSSLSDEAETEEPDEHRSSVSVEEHVVVDEAVPKDADVVVNEPLEVETQEHATAEHESPKPPLVRQPSTDVEEYPTANAQKNKVDEAKKERLTEQLFEKVLDGALDDAVRVATKKRNSADSEVVIDRATLDRVKQLASGHVNELPSPRNTSLSPRSPRDRFMAVAPFSPRSSGVPAQAKSPRQLFAPEVPGLDLDKSIGEHSAVEQENEAWMDDDLSMHTSMAKATVDVAHVSARTPVPSSAFTQDVFSAVPCERADLNRIVSGIADHLWQRRRFGEPLDQQNHPQHIFSLPINSFGSDRSIAVDSDRAFRTMLCDWCAEMATEMFADEQSSGQGVAPSKLKLSRLARARPRSAAELASVLETHVLERLLPPSTAERKKTRVHVVSRRRLERVDEILLEEVYDEEPDWVDYDSDEWALKLDLSQQIWGAVLNETIDQCLRFVVSNTTAH